jgi:uncharacterized protein YggE
MYAIFAAVSIGILAISVVGGLWTNTPNTSVIPTANGKMPTDFVTKQIAGTSTFIQSEEQNDAFQLFVTGTASRKVSPDKVSVTLGVETQEKTAQEAARKNAEIMNAVINGLKELGLNTDQINTSYYNIYPVYEYRPIEKLIPPYPENQVLIGYRVTNTVTITVSASTNIGEIIDTAINASANQVQSVSYFVSEEVQKQISDEMIGEAVLNAKMKAEKALAPLNMQIVGVKNLNLNDVYYPVYRYDKLAFAEAASAPTPILPSDQHVSTSASVTFMIGSK